MNILFYAQFTAARDGKTGLTPTVDVDRISRSDGTATALVTGGGGATEGRHGVYRYLLTGADLQTYDYQATFVTADTTVDLKAVPALWTRYSEAVATDAAGAVTVTASQTVPTTLAGTGDTLVDHNTGGANNLLVTDASTGTAVGGALITAYLKSEFAANVLSTVRGQAFTKDDGTWAQPMKLSSGLTYTLVVTKAGDVVMTKDVTP